MWKRICEKCGKTFYCEGCNEKFYEENIDKCWCLFCIAKKDSGILTPKEILNKVCDLRGKQLNPSELSQLLFNPSHRISFL